MAKLSIPSWKSIKQLPAIWLFAAAPVAVSAQSYSDSTVVLCTSEHEKLEYITDSIQNVVADSIFQNLKPIYLSYHEPRVWLSRNVYNKCEKTKKNLERILLERDPYMGAVEWQYDDLKRKHPKIKLNSYVHDPHLISEVLVHELFHAEGWEFQKNNRESYLKISTDEMQHKYFNKRVMQILTYLKENAVKPDPQLYFDIWSGTLDTFTRVFPVGDSSDIIKYNKRIDQVNRGNMQFTESELDEISEIIMYAGRYVKYITHPSEIYARSRCMQFYLKEKYNIPKENITKYTINKLRNDPKYYDKNFLILIEWFEQEIITYINELQPN